MSQKVTAGMVKELRDRTGVGMSKCKEALDQSEGDMERAIDILRKAGMASAVKKEGRETKEGVIGSAETADSLILVEVNAETDFVTQNERFKQFVSEICQAAAATKTASLEAFLQLPIRSKEMTVDEYRSELVQSLGENIQVKRVSLFKKSPELSFGLYSHMGGKIVTLVELTGGNGNEALARDIAMHIAAESPDYLSANEVPEDVKAREADVAKGQIVGKPANMIEKIVEGKLKAFYDQVCLLGQKYIKDNSISISQLLEKESKRLGKTITIRSFVRWKIGG